MHSDGAVSEIRKQFFRTLSAFVDPLSDPDSSEVNAVDPQFSYSVKVWNDEKMRSLIDPDQIYGRTDTEMMEHIIEGTVDEDGIFRGQIKAFGEWRMVGDDYVIAPPKDFTVPAGPTTRIGPVDLYVATY
jgi:hypothetical protein